MKQYILLTFLLLSVKLFAQPNPAIEQKINQTLSQMTLQDKVGQMAQVSIESLGEIKGDSFVLDMNKANDVVVNYKIGSVLNTPGTILLSPTQWNDLIGQFQTLAKKNKLYIPVLYGLDDNHGSNYIKGATLFPQEI